jgi:hypothetical protein
MDKQLSSASQLPIRVELPSGCPTGQAMSMAHQICNAVRWLRATDGDFGQVEWVCLTSPEKDALVVQLKSKGRRTDKVPQWAPAIPVLSQPASSKDVNMEEHVTAAIKAEDSFRDFYADYISKN